MDSTVPMQVSLGSIRKLTDHESLGREESNQVLP